MRLCVLLLAALVAVTVAVDPCKRQPFRGRCPSQNGETPKRSQFVLRYYLRNGECVSYPYGHCATDPSEPTLYRYKEECEDACISNAPANLGVPKATTEDYEKKLWTEEVKRVEFYGKDTATSTTTVPPPTHTYTTTPSTTTTTTTSSTTTTEDPQPFDFHEEVETTVTRRPSTRLPYNRETTVTQNTVTQEEDEQPFNFVEEHEFAVSSTTTTTTTREITPEPTSTSTTQVSSTTTEATTTTTAEELTEPTTEPTTTEPTTTEPTTTEASTTTTEASTTTVRMTTTSSTVAPTTTTQTTTTTTEATEAPTTTTRAAAPATECQRRRASAATSSIRGAFVPVCTSSGDFERVQCETNGQQCFCVDNHGIEIPNSRTKDGHHPDCYSIQNSRVSKTKECVGAQDSGPCHGEFDRFYYNEDSQKCESFTYSGCGGNGNNYESREACEDRCAPPPVGLPKCEIGEPLKTKIGVPVNCAKTDCPSGYRCSVVQHSSVCCPENNKALGLQTNGRASRCALPKERGPCDKYELRFYFNADLNECKYFFWGGCEGNLNNFERVEECESACGVQRTGEPPRVTNKPNTEIRTTQGIRITPNGGKLSWETEEEEQEFTTTPLAPRSTERVQTTQRAQPTTTTTTRSVPTTTTTTTTRASRIHVQTTTASRVEESEEEEVVEEEEEDAEQKEQPLHVQPPVSQQNTVLLGVNRCLHPRDSGNCRGQFVRWFFDSEKKICDVFTYSGCQGNGNNFASKEECMAICHKPEPTPSATPDFTQVCSNDVDAGECNGVFERFAFDSDTSDCRAFTYGGCGGNGNNFATLAECRSRCVKSPEPKSTCDADIDVGECAGVFARFAFDKSINNCRAFTYGGCGGNANNFATLQECTNKCVNKGVCPETPACDVSRCQLVNDRSGCPFCSCPPVKQASPPGSLSPPKCAPLDKAACREPCMMFHNRQGCEECVCPQTAPVPPAPTRQPTTLGAQPPASSSGARRVEVGPPASRTTQAAPPAPSGVPPRQFAVNTLEHQQPRPTDQLPRTLAAQIEEKCLQPVEPGPCKNFADRWYFNVDDGTCHPFKYGGCAGNRNHFFTQKECEVHCARFLSIHDTESDETAPESAEELPSRRQGLRAHGVPIQPTVPLVVPTYAAPTPQLHGKQGLERLEPLEHLGAHPPAPSTTIVPRLPSARIQGFQVTQKPTTTTQRATEPTTQSTTTTSTTSTPSDVQNLEPQPVIKEVQEEKVTGNTQEVDLEKFNLANLAPRAREPTREFDQEMLGSGAGSGSEFEEESEEVTSAEVTEPTEPTTEASELTELTTKALEPSTEAPELTEPTTTVTAEATEPSTTAPELTTTTQLKKIQIRPRVPSTTTAAAPTTTTTTLEDVTSSEQSPTSTTSTTHQQHHRQPELITTSVESGEIVSDFAFNSDEDTSTHDENMEIVETTESIRASGSKTLEAVKAVETVKQHKELETQEENGISRKVESINIDVPETHRIETLAPAPLPTTTGAPATTQSSVGTQGTVGTTAQPHFEPKFDGRIVCALPPDAGVCTSYTPRWFFNSQTGQCEQFAYGSCGGNENNFFDRSTCERKCMPHHVILAQVPERCSFDKDAGSGKGYNVKWYFNMKNLRCEQFVFEGLGGNTNQFETLSECERICTPAGPKTPTLPPVAPVAQELPQAPVASQPVLELPGTPQVAPIAPLAPVAQPTTTTTSTSAPNLDIDSQEDYDDEDPIILPETNEMPPLPNLAPATFGSVRSPVIGDENVELRLPELVQTVPTVPATLPTTQAPQTDAPTAPPTAASAATVAASIPTIGAPSPIERLAETPIPPAPTTVATPLPPSVEPRPPAAHAAKTVIPEDSKTYKAEPVLGREHIPTANDGQPLVAPSPKETVNYQTGEVKTAKASGIRNFDGAQDSKISVDLFNKGAPPTKSINGMPACANGRTEVRYSDGRPVMCLPGKNQCPDGSSCYFNGIDFFCCPEEEDPYDKHAFGGYGGDETKNGYKVFGALNIRRLMDEVPLRQKRQAQVNFNIDSVVAPLRFDAEKPRTVSRALRMKTSAAVPRHGANPLCIQPVVKGSCEEAHLRYYYDRVTDSCRLFEYSGCDGNANNFGSLEDCQRLCVLNIKNIKNGQAATTTVLPITPEEDEKLAPGQCPGGRAPLGGASPVLCGNSTESIGCPTSFYCRRGPPDVCCPGTDPKLMQPEEIVKEAGRGVVKNESHMPRGFNRQIFLSTPKYMCPDAADPLMLENGEPMLCGSGFDGVKMCPKGYYCAIDAVRNSRLCCPLYGDAQRIASEEIFAPRLASNTETTTPKAQFAEVEDSEEEADEEEEEGEETMGHIKMKPNAPTSPIAELAKTASADLTSEGEVSIDLGEESKVEEEVTTTTEKMVVQDKSACQIKPSEGRMCNESETPTRTNLQYFYSPRDNRCKLFFYRGCGGNLNRFEKKSDCEALCL